MDWVPYVHDALEYIEENLLIIESPKEVADKVFVSEVALQKGFHVLTGYSVFEYIRNRKLYEAAVEIISSNEKIIDIAIKYGYESPEAFTRAFIKFHGINPMALRKNKGDYRRFLPIKVDLVVYGGTKSSIKIVKKYPLEFIGYCRNIDEKIDIDKDSTLVQEFWDDFYNTFYDGYGENGELSKTSAAIEKYGIGEYGLRYTDGEGSFVYMIAGKYTGGEIPDGMVTKSINGGEWAVFDFNGPTKVGISASELLLKKKSIEENSDYVATEEACIEWYESIDEEKSREGYRSALWIPVKRKKTDKDILTKKKQALKNIGIIGGIVISVLLIVLFIVIKSNAKEETKNVWEKYNYDVSGKTGEQATENEKIDSTKDQLFYYDDKLEGELNFEYNRIIEMIPEDLRGGGYIERNSENKEIILHIYITEEIQGLPQHDNIRYEIVKYSHKELEGYLDILVEHKEEIGIENIGIKDNLNKVVIYDMEELVINEERIKELIPEDSYTLIFQGGVEKQRNEDAFCHS